jgi:hypothetical protein
MRNGFSQLGRALSTALVVVLLAAPVSQGATFLLDRDGDSGRVLGPINRVIHAAARWAHAGFGDELIMPRP